MSQTYNTSKPEVYSSFVCKYVRVCVCVCVGFIEASYLNGATPGCVRPIIPPEITRKVRISGPV